MKKKIAVLGTALMIAAAVTACGGKDTKTETTVPVETTVPAESLTPAETTETGESAADTESDSQAQEPSEEGEALSAEEMKAFAEKIQAAVADKDLNALADLCAYPVYVSFGEGEGEELASRDDIIKLKPDQVFTDDMMKEVAGTDVDNLEQFGVGVVVGVESSITFNSVDGKAAVTSIVVQ